MPRFSRLAMVRPMIGKLKTAATVALAAATLAACARREDPAQAAQALLAAVQAGDAKAFEAHIDRPALRAQVRQRLAGVAQASALDLGGPSDATLDRMITPAAFHLVQAGSGAPLSAPPTKDQVLAMMSRLSADRVCLHDAAAPSVCVLTLAREAPGWRLVAMPAPAADAVLAVPPAPAKR